MGGQDAIKVVTFMLNQFRAVILQVPDNLIPLEVHESQSTGTMAAYLHPQTGKRHTIIPQDKCLLTQVFEDWVDQIMGRVGMPVNQPLHYAYLRGGYSSTVAVALFEVQKSVAEIIGDCLNAGEFFPPNGRTDQIERRIPQKYYLSNGHGDKDCLS